MSTSSQHSTGALASITPDDHRAYVWIAAVLSTILAVCTFATRCYVRWNMFGVDDYANCVATAAGIVHFAVVFAGLSSGLAETSDNLVRHEMSAAGSLFLASEALYVFAVYLAKAAATGTVFRLLARDMKTARLFCTVILVVESLCCLAALLLVTVDCSAIALLEKTESRLCSSRAVRWEVITALDGVTELTLLAYFFWIIWPLNMKRRFKATISLLFALRIFCPAFSALHTVSVYHARHSTDPDLATAGPLVWQSIGVAYALFTSLVLALKTFLRSFHMGMGMDVPYSTHPYGKEGSRDASYPLESRTQSSNIKRPSASFQWRTQRSGGSARDEHDAGYRPEQLKYFATVIHEDGPELSIKSGSSSRPIIRHDVQFTISHEDGSAEYVEGGIVAS